MHFQFTQSAYDSIEAMRKAGGYKDFAGLFIDALRLKRCVDSKIAEGYTGLFFRDPDTNEEYQMVNNPMGLMEGQ